MSKPTNVTRLDIKRAQRAETLRRKQVRAVKRGVLIVA